MSFVEKAWRFVKNWWYGIERTYIVCIDQYPKEKVHIGIGGSTKLSANVKTSSPELIIKWQKVENNGLRNLRTDFIKYSGSSTRLPTPELVINNVDKSDDGDYQLEVTTVSGIVTGPKVRVNVFGDTSNALSKEENNFLRYYLLCQTIATESARLYFTRKVPESTLASHLNSYSNYLKSSRWKCTSEQLAVLFPAGNVSSSTFDFTVLYKLIRNTITPLSPPTRGWGLLPSPGEITEEDDIERIRHHRNLLAHNTELKLNDLDFNTVWTDLSQAVIRLSCRTLSLEINNLSKRKLDQQAKNEKFENMKRDLIAMKDDMNRLNHDISECKGVIVTHHERLMKMENSHIPSNVKETHVKLLKQWKIEDELYYDKTRFFKATKNLIQSCSVVGLVGGPGCGKTFLAKHIALSYKQDGWEVIPVADFDKIVMYGDSKLKQIFVIDDILGVFSVNMNWYNNLNSHKEGILEVLGNDSKLLFTCRKSVYYEAVKLQSFVLEKVIDLESKENILNDEEKKNILAKHCRFIGVPEDIYSNLSLPSSSLMFPLLCKIFSTGYKTHVSVDKFFAKPLHCLIRELDTMEYRTPKQYAALVLCVLSNNMLSIEKTVDEKEMKLDAYNTCGVNQGTSDKEIKNVVSNLVGTYLIENGNYFTFIHDAIYEIVAYHYGKTNPLIILRYMNSNFIATKVTVDKDQSNKESTNLLTLIDTKHYVQLAEKIWKNLQSFDLFDVFMSKSLHHLPFLNIFIQTLLEKPYNELRYLICHEQISSKVLEIYSNIVEIKENEDYEIQFKEQARQRLLMNQCGDISVPYNTRTISWIIYYGHTKLLTSIVNLVKENMDSTDIVFGSDITEQTRSLILGCYSGDPDMVNLILKYVKIDCINKTSLDKTLACIDNGSFILFNYHRAYTPLTSVCDTGNISVLKILLKNNAKIDQCDDLNQFPLLTASEQGHIDVVKCLVQNGGDINQCDILKYTSLHMALYKGHYNVVKYLVQQGAQVNHCDIYKMSTLYKASANGHTPIVEFLIENGANINQCDTDNISPLYKACEGGHIALVKFLVKNGADVQQCNDQNQSSLYEASERGHTAVVEFLVGNGANVNQCDKTNRSPLYNACHKGHTAVVEFLVENGANVNQCDKKNRSPLYNACHKGHTAVVEFLVENGANVNQCDALYQPPLYKACEGGHTAVVEFLVEKGATVNQCNTYKQSPLYIASEGGHNAVVELLVENGADVQQCDKDNTSPLYKSCEGGHKAVVDCLLENGADVHQCDRYNKSPLYQASERGHNDIVKILLEKGADVNQFDTDNNSPLYKACKGGHKAVVEFLVEKGSNINNVNKYNKTPLYNACRRGHTAIVEFLVKKGADVHQCDTNNISPLYKACEGGHKAVVEFLVNNGANVNQCDTLYQSPLYKACKGGHTAVVEFLVEIGADVNQCDTDKKSCLYTASEEGHTAIVKFLIENGADFNKYDSYNCSPLYKASQSGHREVVEYLVDNGADLHQCDSNNCSPLYKACKGGHTFVVEYLVEKGADVNHCDKDNKSPLCKASERGDKAVVEFLVENGANVNQCDIDNKSPLYKATRFHQRPNDRRHEDILNIVQYLIKKGADVNQYTKSKRSPLYGASSRGHSDVVKLLIQKGNDVNQCDTNAESPLYKASAEGYFNVVEHLVQHRANVNQQNADEETPLYKASRKGHDSIVKYLLQNGADVNQCNKDKESPLCSAAKSIKSPLQIVQYLVNKGANVNQCSESNKSPLYWASYKGHFEVVEFLVQNGAEVNKCSKYNESPLYRASEVGYVNIVGFLVENGADLTVRDDDSVSVLENTRQLIKQRKYFDWDTDDQKTSLQLLKKHVRRNSI